MEWHLVYLFLVAHREHAIPRQSQMLSSDLLQQISVSGNILLTGSRVSNEPIMNPGGRRGSKSLVNLMRIWKWTVGSQITKNGRGSRAHLLLLLFAPKSHFVFFFISNQIEVNSEFWITENWYYGSTASHEDQ